MNTREGLEGHVSAATLGCTLGCGIEKRTCDILEAEVVGGQTEGRSLFPHTPRRAAHLAAHERVDGREPDAWEEQRQ